MWQAISHYYCVDWIALVLNATAIHLLGKKQKAGFSLGILANITWIAFGVLAHSMATVVACSIFVALNAKGWWCWSAKPILNNPDAGGGV